MPLRIRALQPNQKIIAKKQHCKCTISNNYLYICIWKIITIKIYYHEKSSAYSGNHRISFWLSED